MAASVRQTLRLVLLAGLPLLLVLAACAPIEDTADEQLEAGQATGATEGTQGTETGDGSETASATGAAGGGGSLTYAAAPPNTIDPHMMSSLGDIHTVQPVVNYLVRLGSDLSLQPDLATEWESEDGQTWTFTLREGVTFHDGSDFTAEDVVATFDRLVDPEVASAAAGSFTFLEKGGTTAVDDHTVQFDLTEPVGDFPAWVTAYQAAILPSDWEGDFATNPIGTGPFELTEYTPRQGARYERNPDYWEEGLPKLDSMEAIYYEDFGAQITAIQSGDVDLMTLLPGDLVDTVPTGGGVEVLSAPSATHGQITMRVDMEPWDDVRVRQAMALTVDREQIVEELWGGHATVANDHTLAPVYEEAEALDVEQRAQDIERAQQLLTEAGHPDGIDVELTTYGGIGIFAQAVAEMAAPAGIRIEITVEPTDVYYQHWTDLPLAMETWLHRSSIAQMPSLAFRCGADWNVPHWCNEDFDALIGELNATVDEGERAEIAAQMAAILHEEVPSVIAWFQDTLSAVRDNVSGYESHPANFVDFRTTTVE